MSDANFKRRLQRIDTSPERKQHGQDGRTPRYGLLVLGALAFAFGLQTLRYTNENYETVRDSFGVAAAAGLGFAGMIILLIGCVGIIRAVLFKRPRPATSADYGYSIIDERSTQRVSGARKILSTLIGVLFGASACVLMFMAASARIIDTEPAQQFAFTSVLAAFLLLITSLLFTILGLFFRGNGLWRVLTYFLLSACVTFAIVRIAEINMLAWPHFVEMLQ